MIWLWLTVLFANLAEAVAEGRARPRPTRCASRQTDTIARRLTDWSPGSLDIGATRQSPHRNCGRATSWWSRRVRSFPVTVMWWKALPQSTNRPSPVSRRRWSANPAATVRGDRRDDWCSRIASSSKIDPEAGESFIDRMIALVEGANRQKTPNEIALNILLGRA